MNKWYCFACLLVTCEMLTLHILRINGQSTADEDYLQRSAMKQVDNDIRGINTWMNQRQETPFTVQKEFQQQRGSLSVVRLRCESLQRKTEEQLLRGNAMTHMSTTEPEATANGSVEIIATTETMDITSQVNVTGSRGISTGPLKILSGESAFVAQGYLTSNQS
jgi:hypothetical protein